MADDEAGETLNRLMKAEFRDFEQTLPVTLIDPGMFGGARQMYAQFPSPAREGGLPEGWHVRSHTCYARHGDTEPTRPEEFTDTKRPGFETAVIERADGGWSMVFHTPDAVYGRDNVEVPTTRLWESTSLTLAGLYADAVLLLDSAGRRGARPERDLRAYLLSLYDLTNPVEEAEATLIGLGAPVTVFPKAATPAPPEGAS